MSTNRRMRRSRMQTMHWMKRTTRKDTEGSTYDSYGAPVAFDGEWWPASGEVQARMYGEQLSYIRNVKIKGDYTVTVDEKGIVHYVYPSGLDVCELDGIGIDLSDIPDYKIVAIEPHKPLILGVKRL